MNLSPHLLASCCALFLVGCGVSPPPEPDPGPAPSDCAPEEQGLQGFSRVEGAWGLATGLEPPVTGNSAQAGLIVSDLDGDGDLDVLMGRANEHPGPGPYRGLPRVFSNQEGRFTEVFQEERPTEFYLGPAAGVLAVDLTGDRLPELIRFGEGWFDWLENQGDLTWGPRNLVLESPPGPDGPLSSVGPRINAMSAGDVDGDGDLDLLVTSLQVIHQDSPSALGGQGSLPDAYPHQLYGNEDGVFVLWEELDPYEDGSYSQLAVFTDRDSDGDQDIYLLSEYGGLPGAAPSAFWRNDGVDGEGRPSLTNDAVEMNADIGVGGMGFDSADLNGDGLLDYCIIQFGPTYCLFSDAGGPYYDAATAIGLQIPADAMPTGGPPPWSGYSLELVDLDLDGDLDAAVSAANPSPEAADTHVDRIYEQVDGQFVERSQELDFNDSGRHYGLVAADLDGDGSLEILISTKEADPILWTHACPTGSWVEVDLIGPPGNREGHGAQVRLEAGGRVQVEELYNLRTLGQGPARIHFGLGDAEVIDRIEVLWPGGQVDLWEDLAARQTISLAYGG